MAQVMSRSTAKNVRSRKVNRQFKNLEELQKHYQAILDEQGISLEEFEAAVLEDD